MRTDAAASGPLAPRPSPALLCGPQPRALPLSRDSRDRVVPRGCRGCPRRRAPWGDRGSVGAEDMTRDPLCCGRRDSSRPPVLPVLRRPARMCSSRRDTCGPWHHSGRGAVGRTAVGPGELTDAHAGLCGRRARRCSGVGGRPSDGTPALNTAAWSGRRATTSAESRVSRGGISCA